MVQITFLLALAFASIHLFVGKLTLSSRVPRSRWLSAAGGVAVAYVFLHVLPELGAHQQALAEALNIGMGVAKTLVYASSLVGLAVFYGLERAATASRQRVGVERDHDLIEAEIFWLHIAAFGFYNMLIGYLLLHQHSDGWSLGAYFVAVSVHFITSDFALREDQRVRYDAKGRWALAAAVLAGWALGVKATLPDAFVGFFFALLAGGLILNVLKEELPESRRSRFGAFVAGLIGYAGVDLAIG